jgi:hypothetical protein
MKIGDKVRLKKDLPVGTNMRWIDADGIHPNVEYKVLDYIESINKDVLYIKLKMYWLDWDSFELVGKKSGFVMSIEDF